MNDLPSSYFIGQDYFEDERKVKVVILCQFHPPSFINEIEFNTTNSWVHGVYNSGDYWVTIERDISEKLLDELSLALH